MIGERVEVDEDGLVRLQSAAVEFARIEVTRISQAVVLELRDRSVSGLFGDRIAARHLWDEYCWSLQEGPFDDDMGFADVRLGSLSDAFDEAVHFCIEVEIDKLPKHALVLLSAKAFDEDVDSDPNALGGIWKDGIASLILEAVSAAASKQNLEIIGPDRADTIRYAIEAAGTVWPVLSSRDEIEDLLAEHADAMIDPASDLSSFARDLIERFLLAVSEEADGTAWSEFEGRFNKEIRSMLFNEDVLPSLKAMRQALLVRLDG